ncbi:MAG TPA: 2-amino-4-hydroxy-6-hydroxymethyldihydropteridine diphosphokinase [Pelobium sp.]
MNQVFLALGGNLGNRVKNIEKALALIEQSVGSLTKVSSMYETAPWGKSEQANFLNMVVRVSTSFSAIEVLNKIQKIETDLGRIRKETWGARTMDLDILFFNDEVIESERLIIPHALMHERKFVLIPMEEIAPGFVHPIFNKTIKQLLLMCKDNLNVKYVQKQAK